LDIESSLLRIGIRKYGIDSDRNMGNAFEMIYLLWF